MPDRKPIKIMLVEDHEITRLGLRITLEKIDDLQIVAEAATGFKAVDMALQFNPQVILMDIGLPGMDGIEAARKIKLNSPDIRVIMFTTHDHDDDIFAALSAGADGYCLKDAPSEQIVMAIRAVSQGVSWLDAGIARKVLNAIQHNHSPAEEHLAKIQDKDKFNLSPRELETLELVVQGMTNPEIAKHLFITAETVKTHMRHIMEKLVVSDRTQAAVKALQEGLIMPDSAR